MNEKNPQEIAYRRVAFKFFDKEKSAAYILMRIPRSRSWLFKWKQRFEQQGWQALDSLPKTPLNSPQEHPTEAVELVLGLRKRLEKSHVGLIGPRAIQQEILRLRLLKSPPSLASIKRWLKEAELTGGAAEPDPAAYYPLIQAADDFVVYACDWLARYLTGGEKVFIFHTINWRTHALSQTILSDKTTPPHMGICSALFPHWGCLIFCSSIMTPLSLAWGAPGACSARSSGWFCIWALN